MRRGVFKEAFACMKQESEIQCVNTETDGEHWRCNLSCIYIVN